MTERLEGVKGMRHMPHSEYFGGESHFNMEAELIRQWWLAWCQFLLPEVAAVIRIAPSQQAYDDAEKHGLYLLMSYNSTYTVALMFKGKIVAILPWRYHISVVENLDYFPPDYKYDKATRETESRQPF